MKFALFFFVLISFTQALWATNGRELFLDIEDGDPPISVFNNPGYNWATCKTQSGCESVGWLKPDDTKIYEVLDSKGNPIIETRQVMNPVTREMEEVSFIRVRFSYTRKGKDGWINSKVNEDGWIDADTVNFQKMKSVYAVPPKKEEPCNATDGKAFRELSRTSRAIHQAAAADLAKATSVLKPLVGKCPLNPPPTKSQLKFDGGLFYDNQVWPQVAKHKSEFPKTIQTESGAKKISFDDYAKIDALARTLYGEMAGCMTSTPVYGMAAAKVALNRAELIDKGHAMKAVFEKPGTHDEKLNKSALVSALTAPEQFSVWNKGAAKNPKDLSILRTMCPTSGEKSTHNWKNEMPSAVDNNVWDKVLKIATEAVVFPESFKERTKSVRQYYYTSNVDWSRKGYQKVSPEIEGRSVNNRRCMWVWKSPKKENLPD
ncbi:MAG: hypothetical protein BroJett040_16620 [Oligoflexia bacterium]|nr:MAG: hypothetical protein BroJett040_16620 [Oligoflexia bacterium]